MHILTISFYIYILKAASSIDGWLTKNSVNFPKSIFFKNDGCADYALKIVEMTLKETFER